MINEHFNGENLITVTTNHNPLNHLPNIGFDNTPTIRTHLHQQLANPKWPVALASHGLTFYRHYASVLDAFFINYRLQDSGRCVVALEIDDPISSLIYGRIAVECLGLGLRFIGSQSTQQVLTFFVDIDALPRGVLLFAGIGVESEDTLQQAIAEAFAVFEKRGLDFHNYFIEKHDKVSNPTMAQSYTDYLGYVGERYYFKVFKQNKLAMDFTVNPTNLKLWMVKQFDELNSSSGALKAISGKFSRNVKLYLFEDCGLLSYKIHDRAKTCYIKPDMVARYTRTVELHHGKDAIIHLSEKSK